MPDHSEKARVVEELRSHFEAAPLIVLADFKGITVKNLDKVRRSCEKGGIKFQVVKNTLCERAVQGTEKEKLGNHFRGNIAVLFSNSDPIGSARLLRDQLKEHDKLVVRAGFFEGDILDGKGVTAVADLPGREELLSTLLRSIQEGPRQVLGVIEAPARDLLYLLTNYASKLEEGA